jgi:hypothetical protein
MEVVRNRNERTITLSQAAYVDKIIRRFGLEESYGVSTPLDPNVVLSKDMCPQTEAGRRAMKDIPYLVGWFPHVRVNGHLSRHHIRDK